MEDKTDEQAEEDDEEVDDEELNEIIKRGDEDLVVFNRMDLERRREENEFRRRARAQGEKWERLIQEEELPEIYQHDEVPADDESPSLEMGRGQRSRDRVRYDDGLTEEQWLNVSFGNLFLSVIGRIANGSIARLWRMTTLIWTT